jgi:hypothetical protein
MRRSTPFLAGAACALLTLAHGQDAPAPAPPIAWRRDLEGARAEARAAGKPLFLVFRCET